MHQIWLGKKSEKPVDLMKTVEDNHKDWEYKLWTEENVDEEVTDTGAEAMRSAGITPGGIAGDLGTADLGDVPPDELGPEGEEGVAPEDMVAPPLTPPAETPGL